MQKKLYKFSHALKRIPHGIVKARWVFAALFVALTIFGCVMIPRTKINYDLTGYLPESSGSSAAMKILHEEFDDKGMAYVMVKDITEEHADEIKSELEGVKGVATVTYVKEINYKNNAAMYTVTLSDYDSTEGAFSAVENIIDALSDEKSYLSGQSAFSYYTKLETEQSILKLGIAIVVIILLVMFFTSKTYFEIVVLVVVFAVAMAINMGTNFVFNGISYISNLVALVLQLALSLDYSIILLRRYTEERYGGLDKKEACVAALTKGMPEILSSSLTTIAGLCALMLMSLGIGAEIGLSLAKGIVISMAVVVFFMPAMLILCDKPIMKSQHKSFVPDVTRPARAVVKAKKVIVPVFLIIAVLAGVGQGFNKYSFNYNSGSLIVGPKKEIRDAGFGTLNSLVIVVPKGNPEKERELAGYVNSLSAIDASQTTALSTIDVYSFIDPEGNTHLYLTDKVSKDDIFGLIDAFPATEEQQEQIAAAKKMIGTAFDNCLKKYGEAERVRVVDFLDYLCTDVIFDKDGNVNPLIGAMLGDNAAYLGQIKQISFAKSNLESENYTRMTFNIDADIEDDEAFAVVSEVKNNIGNYFDENYVTGESVVCYEMSGFFTHDNLFVCLFTDLFILIILLFTFKNVALPIILILAIQGGIFINFAIPFLAGNSICFIGYLIISAIQMGATIDYAIVLTNRYRTIKGGFDDKADAMAAAENAVFSTVITSGVILTATGFVMGVLSSGVVSQLGMLLGIGTLTSLVIVLFVLPSMLLIADKFVDKTDFKKLFRRKSKTVKVEPGMIEPFYGDSVNKTQTENSEDNSAISDIDMEQNHK